MYFSSSINIVLDSTFLALGRGFTAAPDHWGTFDVVWAVFFRRSVVKHRPELQCPIDIRYVRRPGASRFASEACRGESL